MVAHGEDAVSTLAGLSYNDVPSLQPTFPRFGHEEHFASEHVNYRPAEGATSSGYNSEVTTLARSANGPEYTTSGTDVHSESDVYSETSFRKR